MACPNVLPHVDAFVDGELDPSPQVEIERHVAVCEHCRREVTATRALKAALRAQADEMRAPEALRVRVRGALGEARDGARWGDRAWSGTLLVAAAGMLVVFGAGLWPATPERTVVAPAPLATQSVALLPDVIERHTDPLPTESGTERPEDVPNWFRGKLGFRVGPVQFQAPGVTFLGARVSQVGAERAAKLYYRVGSSRVTVVAFEASPSVRRALARELEASRHALIGGHDVAYHSVRGYTVPVFEDGGVVYAITGDVDQRTLLNLLESARLP
jgi:anti-sigma factor (TIGR02949 family)